VNKPLPKYITKFFWGDDLSQLNWADHKKYIVKTLLSKGDKKAISWLLKRVNAGNLKKQLPILKLDSKSNNFWSLYLR
jgi:hypothetical protein